MSITLIKERGQFRIISATGTMLEGVPIVLYTKEETMDPWKAAELDSLFADDEDWGDTLDALVVNENVEVLP